MKLKISSKFIITFIMIIILAFLCNRIIALAVSQSDLNEKNKQIEETEAEISDVKKEMSTTMQEVQELVGQISEYETEIASLDTQIEEINTNIDETEKNLEKTQKELEEKQKLLDQRLVALYETGNTTYIDVLLSSKGITDFISNYYLIEEIASYDTELIQTVEKAKQEIEEAKEQLENSKAELEATKEKQVAKQNALSVVKNEKESKVSSLSEEEKQLEAELTQFEKDKQDITNQLVAYQKQNNSGGSGTSSTTVIVPSTPSACGYIFPVAGLSQANINNKTYPSYAGHTGVDININVVGKSVVAVKDGTVVTSTAIRNSDGSYRSYGEYIVIDHHDGTMTLYGHMRAGSRTVQSGQTVSQGQVIGIVGSTGNSSGDHLHFEVRVGGYPVNPFPYLP